MCIRDRDILTAITFLLVVYSVYRIETKQYNQHVFNVQYIQPRELRHFQNQERLEQFLEMDTTDLLDYRGDFKCLNFAEMLSYRAMENGYRVVVLEDAWNHNVTVRHAYCMAYCLDEDTFYVIEPQTDEIIYTWKYGE